MTIRALAAVALALLASACAPRFDPRLVDVPIAGRPWVSTENVRHPLVGKIWAPRAGRFVDEAALDAALASADDVALGEVHDNPDHHLLQARLLRAVIASGRRPALGFEMLDADQQAAVDGAVAAAPRDPDALGRAVRWDDSGWPDFQWYRPIFAAGLEAGLPVVAANLARGQTKEIRTKGKEALSEALRSRLARDEPLPATVLAALRAEMAESHCGMLPADKLDPLVLVQRARDAQMALRMETAGAGRGAVLVTGSGHARDDRGVPAVMSRDAPGAKVVAVGLFEVTADQTDPATYRLDPEDKGPAPFDFVVFTPGARREDPCEGMRKHVEEMRAAAAKEGKAKAPPAGPAPAAPPKEPAPARP